MTKHRASSPRGASEAGRSAFARGQDELRRRRARQALSGALLLSAAAGAGGVVLEARGHHDGSTLGVVLWALAGTCLLAAAAYRPRGDPARWARGARGEMATAELLGRLSPRRWVVLHDLGLPASRANVDHLVIGPTGVWVIDTKSYRAVVRVKRGHLWAGKSEVELGAVGWEAGVISDLLGETTRTLVAVHGAIGHGLPRRGRLCQGTRVLPASGLVRRLRRGRLLRPRLSPRRVRQLADVAGSELSAARRATGPGRAARSTLVSK